MLHLLYHHRLHHHPKLVASEQIHLYHRMNLMNYHHQDLEHGKRARQFVNYNTSSQSMCTNMKLHWKEMLSLSTHAFVFYRLIERVILKARRENVAGWDPHG